LKPDAIGENLFDPRFNPHAHTKVLEQLARALGQPFGQSRKDPVPSLDQVDLDILFRVDAVEAEGHELARRLVKLGRQLRAGGAGADNSDVELFRP